MTMAVTRNYKVHFDGISYLVQEIATNLTLGEFDTNANALKVALRLESGAGFNGITPTFFVSNSNPIVSREVRGLLAN